MEPKCKNCRFWDKHKFSNYGDCKSGKIKYDEKLGYQDFQTEELDMLIYCDLEEYRAIHNTGPEFGCIHFKEKV